MAVFSSTVVVRSSPLGSRFPARARSEFEGSPVRMVPAPRVRPRSAVAAPVQAFFNFGGGASKTADDGSGLYDFSVKDAAGKSLKMSSFKGKVVLIVNVASQCGFTPQYAGLGELYNKYKSKGLVVLGFPCNQFGAQEPGTAKEIQSCAVSFGAKFPLMAKIDVNGSDADPLFSYLKDASPKGLLGGGGDVQWNFGKFLIDKEGNVVKRAGSMTTPESLEAEIVKLL